MAAPKTEILEALQELMDNEFKDFKWHLCNCEDSGIASIPRGKLENANRHDVVDIMVQRYSASDAGVIAIRMLRSINQNELANRLNGKLSKECSSGEDGGAGGGGSRTKVSSGAGAQTSGVSVNIQSSSGASVKAPVLHVWIMEESSESQQDSAINRKEVNKQSP